MEDYGEGQKEEIEQIFSEFGNLNALPGPIIQRVLRFKADSLIGDTDGEQHLIHLLVESHTPTLRLKAELQVDFNDHEEITDDIVLKKHHLQFFRGHPLSFNDMDHDLMCNRIAEMPEEWTVVQITPFFSGNEIFGKNSFSTNGIHITVFNSGCKNEEPFCISLPKQYPLSSIQDIRNIKEKLGTAFVSKQENGSSKTLIGKQLREYHKQRKEIVTLLEALVYDLETDWLGPWKCLFSGKFVNRTEELRIRSLVTKFLEEKSLGKVSKKIENILVQAVKDKSNVKSVQTETGINTILEYCFPCKNLGIHWATFWKEHELSVENEERHPTILIVDESLDSLPWEMISTLKEQPCTRMPSLHLLYAIFKAHEDTIKNGYKIISNNTNGKFILNPGLDLIKMETRLKHFYEYWFPEWEGIASRAPTSTEFRDMLTTADIFCYSGHGSGTQYCSSEKIKNKKINSVVCLFGCGSTQCVELGPEVEMYWRSQIYFLAACPCIVGMLWIVTDCDTDLLTTKFLSYWIPNSKKKHWKFIDHNEWQQTGKVKIDEKKSDTEMIKSEPSMLKALLLAKHEMKSFFNKSAVVVRGIPVKLMNEQPL